MPEMDGYEFVEIIKHPNTLIFHHFVTAISDEPFINKTYELGAVDFLFKPLVIK
jgi:response regulator RpfG family c-di-GMP phosphodiesterase